MTSAMPRLGIANDAHDCGRACLADVDPKTVTLDEAEDRGLSPSVQVDESVAITDATCHESHRVPTRCHDFDQGAAHDHPVAVRSKYAYLLGGAHPEPREHPGPPKPFARDRGMQ